MFYFLSVPHDAFCAELLHCAPSKKEFRQLFSGGLECPPPPPPVLRWTRDALLELSAINAPRSGSSMAGVMLLSVAQEGDLRRYQLALLTPQ